MNPRTQMDCRVKSFKSKLHQADIAGSFPLKYDPWAVIALRADSALIRFSCPALTQALRVITHNQWSPPKCSCCQCSILHGQSPQTARGPPICQSVHTLHAEGRHTHPSLSASRGPISSILTFCNSVIMRNYPVTNAYNHRRKQVLKDQYKP